MKASVLKYSKNTLFLLMSLMLSCSSDDDGNLLCGSSVIVSQSQFEQPYASDYIITNVMSMGTCLEVTISSGGCDGSTWATELVSSVPITNGFDTTSSLSLKLTNEELCEAFISRSFSFDLNQIIEGSTTITFMLEGWDDAIIFSN